MLKVTKNTKIHNILEANYHILPIIPEDEHEYRAWLFLTFPITKSIFIEDLIEPGKGLTVEDLFNLTFKDADIESLDEMISNIERIIENHRKDKSVNILKGFEKENGAFIPELIDLIYWKEPGERHEITFWENEEKHFLLTALQTLLENDKPAFIGITNKTLIEYLTAFNFEMTEEGKRYVKRNLTSVKVNAIHRCVKFFERATEEMTGDNGRITIPIAVADPSCMPHYAHANDAGMDICAAEDVLIGPGETKLVGTGCSIAVPEGYECQVRPRSGISLNTPLRIANSPGTIDAGYRDEVKVMIHNTSREFEVKDGTLQVIEREEGREYLISEKGNKPGWYQIKKGDRIAQLVFNKVEHVQFVSVASVEHIGKNRGGGFGSTGYTSEEKKDYPFLYVDEFAGQKTDNKDSLHEVYDAGLKQGAKLHRYYTYDGEARSAIYIRNFKAMSCRREDEITMIEDWNDQ